MSLLSFVGFSAQLIVIASIAAILISCVTSLQASFVANVQESDATLPITASSCAKSMVSPVYVATIDEPSAPADDLSTLTIRQLKALCKECRFKGYSSLRKHELVELLSAL